MSVLSYLNGLFFLSARDIASIIRWLFASIALEDGPKSIRCERALDVETRSVLGYERTEASWPLHKKAVESYLVVGRWHRLAAMMSVGLVALVANGQESARQHGGWHCRAPGSWGTATPAIVDRKFAIHLRGVMAEAALSESRYSSGRRSLFGSYLLREGSAGLRAEAVMVGTGSRQASDLGVGV